MLVRDDTAARWLPDGGATIFRRYITAVRSSGAGAAFDFGADGKSRAQPDADTAAYGDVYTIAHRDRHANADHHAKPHHNAVTDQCSDHDPYRIGNADRSF